MSADSCFTDTNLLLYSFDARDAVKRSMANNWIDYLWRTGKRTPELAGFMNSMQTPFAKQQCLRRKLGKR